MRCRYHWRWFIYWVDWMRLTIVELNRTLTLSDWWAPSMEPDTLLASVAVHGAIHDDERGDGDECTFFLFPHFTPRRSYMLYGKQMSVSDFLSVPCTHGRWRGKSCDLFFFFPDSPRPPFSQFFFLHCYYYYYYCRVFFSLLLVGVACSRPFSSPFLSLSRL